MRLDYLLFDCSDEDDGFCSFDALASVMPDRLPALVREIEAVLGWAAGEFGESAADGAEGEWSFDLQATVEGGAALAIGYDGKVRVPRAPDSRVTVSLTVSGTPGFGIAYSARSRAPFHADGGRRSS